MDELLTRSGTLVAISGLGSIGLQHVAAFASLPGVRLVVFDPDPALRESAASFDAVVACVDDFAALLDARPAALVVAGPDEVHVSQVFAATRVGVPTLVEKPVASSLAEARRLVTQADPTPVVVGYVLRHREVVLRTRELLTAQAIGRPVAVQVMLGAYVTIEAARSRFARPGRDRLYRDYSHEWDYLRWFFGPITRAFAVARTERAVPHVEVPNCVDAVLEFASDLRALVHLDYVEPVGTRTVHVLGTDGSLFADLGRGVITVRTTDDVVGYELGEPPAAALRRQAAHLLAVSRGEASPAVNLDDGVAALAASEAVRLAAERSAWTDLPALA